MSPTSALLCASCLLAANLLPSYDAPETAWWTRAWGGSEPNTTWATDPSGRTGSCVTIAGEGDGADAAWTAVVTAKPRTFYRLSGWIRTARVRGATGALLNIQNMQEVRTPAVTGTRDWTRVSTTFRTADAPLDLEVNCVFGGWGRSTGQAWYEDIALEEVRVTEPKTARVTIDTKARAVPYSRLIYGGFLEHFGRVTYGGVLDPGSPLADGEGFRTDVLEALEDLGVPIIRWPGGCFASGYHWRGGVGPRREPADDMAWGVREPNIFGTAEFVELCDRIDCVPYICNNAGNGTIDEMREWVEYCGATDGEMAELRRANGHPEPLDVPIWSIGNENWGGHEIGNKTPEEWAPLVRDAARAMKDADPEIILTAAALPDAKWTLPLLSTAGEYLDYISIHNYWIGNWNEIQHPSYLDCIMLSEGPESLISGAIGVLDEAGFRGRIKLAVDEWNLRSFHHPGFPRKTVQDYDDPEVRRLVAAREESSDPTQYTMADALFSASFLNACLRHADDVGMANIAPLVNAVGPLFVHPDGIVKRTSYHALAMYANLLSNYVGTAQVETDLLTHGNRCIPVVDAIATTNEHGDFWRVALVNRHPSSAIGCTVALGDRLLSGSVAATVLAGDSPDAYNDIEHPDRVAPVDMMVPMRDGAISLPPHSLAVVYLPAG